MAAKLLLAALTILATSGDALRACTCSVPDLSEAAVANAVADADMVFKGEVVHVEQLRVPLTGAQPGFRNATMAIFELSGFWKGSDGPSIAVFSGDGHSDCGLGFKVGESWLIFAKYSHAYLPEALNTSMCSLSSQLPDRRGVEAKLGPPKLPYPKTLRRR